ncbi:Hypothetical predicted protein [Octopus vulgaris]|uniref:Uncharacterized protein n=1 Tax=Octopus vulgaris TaxID=6645 RepID=A0AA36BMJ1_OCTVU|nr:Hypothetical predicted protein [Octopus vulgaris]
MTRLVQYKTDASSGMQQFTIWCCLRLWSLCLITFITWSTYIEACKPQQGYEIYIMFPEDAAVAYYFPYLSFSQFSFQYNSNSSSTMWSQ